MGVSSYNGLTTADKTALLDAKARGAEWVARDSEDQANELMAYYCKPKKHSELGAWLVDQDDILRSSIFLFVNDMLFVQWSDPEPVNIDLALAQIAEMESNTLTKEQVGEVLAEIIENIEGKSPLTWNERINQMMVEEKVTLFQHDDCFIYKLTGTAYCDRHLGCEECTKQFLNSPYTEGGRR